MSILCPLLGAIGIALNRARGIVREVSVAAGLITLGCALGAWQSAADQPAGGGEWLSDLTGVDLLGLDGWSAPLPALASMLCLLVMLATSKAKAPRFPFVGALVSLSILLLTISCRHAGLMALLMVAEMIPPLFELRARSLTARVYMVHMGIFAALLLAAVLLGAGSRDDASSAGTALLLAAVMIRFGAAPAHVWLVDLFERATFGTALLRATPMVAACAAIRWVLPAASAELLRAMQGVAIATALYAACMAVVEVEARRFFSFMFVSHGSLVFVGLGAATALTLTGALWLWISGALALTGFGLVLRSIESRAGRLQLDRYHGLFAHVPELGALFLMTGLASIGFPGTIGFVGAELLVDGMLSVHPLLAAFTVVATALNGIAVVQAYFRIFTGRSRQTLICLKSRPSERAAVLVLTAIILTVGLTPGLLLPSRGRAGEELAARGPQRLVAAPALTGADRRPAATQQSQ
jgi:NADH-quinone oxidoreductase subunit M